MTGKQAVMVIFSVAALLGGVHAVVPTAAAQTTTSVSARAIQVIAVDTSDPIALELVFNDLETKVAYRTRFRDLPGGNDRDKLVQSFEDRSPIWVEMAIRRVDGKLWSFQMLRALGPAD